MWCGGLVAHVQNHPVQLAPDECMGVCMYEHSSLHDVSVGLILLVIQLQMEFACVFCTACWYACGCM
jgi:hypothetical protein